MSEKYSGLKIIECKVCGSDSIKDLCERFPTTEYNYICNDCGAHYYLNRWWTLEDWEDYVNDV